MIVKPLIIDWDSTLVASQKAICHIYNEMFYGREGFVEADWTKTNKWDMSDQCTLLPKYDLTVIDLFETQRFFNIVEFYDGAREALEELSTHTSITICSSGTAENISRKVLWINKYLPFANIVPVIVKNSNGIGKQIVDMKGAVFIDDHATNLETSNADIKICYGKYYEWNEDYQGLRMMEWSNSAVENIKELIYQ